MFSVIALGGFSPMAVGSLRVIFASAFLLIILKVFGQSLVKSLSHWKFVTIYGTAFSTLPFLALPWALQFVSSSAAAISFASIPLWVLVLSRIFLKIPITPLKWVGFAIGSIGLIFLAGNGTDSINSISVSVLLLISLFSEITPFPVPSSSTTTDSMKLLAKLESMVKLMLPVLLMSLPKQWPPMTSVLSLLWIGIIATGLATVIRGILIKREGILFTSTNSYIVPVFASVLGASFLGGEAHNISWFRILDGSIRITPF